MDQPVATAVRIPDSPVPNSNQSDGLLQRGEPQHNQRLFSKKDKLLYIVVFATGIIYAVIVVVLLSLVVLILLLSIVIFAPLIYDRFIQKQLRAGDCHPCWPGSAVSAHTNCCAEQTPTDIQKVRTPFFLFFRYSSLRFRR